MIEPKKRNMYILRLLLLCCALAATLVIPGPAYARPTCSSCAVCPFNGDPDAYCHTECGPGPSDCYNSCSAEILNCWRTCTGMC